MTVGLLKSLHDYLSLIAPKDYERDEVTLYRKRLYDLLDAEFGLMQFFQSGSFGHGTAVSPYSDVDYIARLPYDSRPNNSATILQKMKDYLSSHLWEATSITIDHPTVRVDFSGLVTRYEIVPAFLERGGVSDDSDTVLVIPGPSGGWRESAPKAHLAFVRDLDKERNGNVRATARLLKAWKYEHGVPLSSFYLEMRSAAFAKTHASMWSFTAIRYIAQDLLTQGLPAMNDPTSLVSRISPCASQAQRSTALVDLRQLVEDLNEANTAWLDDDNWRLTGALQRIFGNQFPYVMEA